MAVLFKDEENALFDSEYTRRVMPPQSPGEGDLNDGEMREENDGDAFAAASGSLIRLLRERAVRFEPQHHRIIDE